MKSGHPPVYTIFAKGAAAMVTVGLAGGSGSGKGYLCARLALHGIPSFDCDAVYHAMISSDSAVTRELVSVFGEGIRSPEGGIDRTALRAIVFTDGAEDARLRLNEITHRHIREACLRWIDGMRSEGKEAAVVDAPLLFESGFDRLCDLTVAVTAPIELRVRRILSRDGIGEDAARRRIAAQISDSELSARADLVIENDGDATRLSQQIEQLLHAIRRKHHV